MKVDVVCEECGVRESVYPSRAETYRYCSTACKSEAWREGPTLTCPHCGEDFHVPPSTAHRRVYCSTQCRADGLGERFFEMDWTRTESRPRVTISCEWCETEFDVPPSLAGRRFCSRDCHDEYQTTLRGEETPNWKGGYDLYVGGWLQQRLVALGRADYACEECGRTDEEHRDRHGFGLDVHHLTPLVEFDDPAEAHVQSNLRVLCRKCHTNYDGK